MSATASATAVRFQVREFNIEGKLISDDWRGFTDKEVKTHLFYRKRYLGAGRIEVIDLSSETVIQALERNNAWANWAPIG